MRYLLLWGLLASLSPSIAYAKAPPHGRALDFFAPKKAFEKMKCLVGDWEATLKNGKKIKVNYRFIANETVLAETWVSSSGRESMSMYHFDGPSLILTHYCPQGNQPRLKYLPKSSSQGELSFIFDGGSSLQDLSKSHMVGFRFQFYVKDGRFNYWTQYSSEGKRSQDSLVFHRVGK